MFFDGERSYVFGWSLLYGDTAVTAALEAKVVCILFEYMCIPADLFLAKRQKSAVMYLHLPRITTSIIVFKAHKQQRVYPWKLFCWTFTPGQINTQQLNNHQLRCCNSKSQLPIQLPKRQSARLSNHGNYMTWTDQSWQSVTELCPSGQSQAIGQVYEIYFMKQFINMHPIHKIRQRWQCSLNCSTAKSRLSGWATVCG